MTTQTAVKPEKPEVLITVIERAKPILGNPFLIKIVGGADSANQAEQYVKYNLHLSNKTCQQVRTAFKLRHMVSEADWEQLIQPQQDVADVMYDFEAYMPGILLQSATKMGSDIFPCHYPALLREMKDSATGLTTVNAGSDDLSSDESIREACSLQHAQHRLKIILELDNKQPQLELIKEREGADLYKPGRPTVAYGYLTTPAKPIYSEFTANWKIVCITQRATTLDDLSFDYAVALFRNDIAPFRPGDPIANEGLIRVGRIFVPDTEYCGGMTNDNWVIAANVSTLGSLNGYGTDGNSRNQWLAKFQSGYSFEYQAVWWMDRKRGTKPMPKDAVYKAVAETGRKLSGLGQIWLEDIFGNSFISQPTPRPALTDYLSQF